MVGSHDAKRRRAAAIYGTVVTAAVLASAGTKLPTKALAVAVVVTLLVYWAAEQYAELLAEQSTRGHLPRWPVIRASLRNSWPMVSASYIPVLALVLARAGGLPPSSADNVALAVTVGLLVVHCWRAAGAAGLSGVKLWGAAALGGLLGVAMILLKILVVSNLH